MVTPPISRDSLRSPGLEGSLKATLTRSPIDCGCAPAICGNPTSRTAMVIRSNFSISTPRTLQPRLERPRLRQFFQTPQCPLSDYLAGCTVGGQFAERLYGLCLPQFHHQVNECDLNKRRVLLRQRLQNALPYHLPFTKLAQSVNRGEPHVDAGIVRQCIEKGRQHIVVRLL